MNHPLVIPVDQDLCYISITDGFHHSSTTRIDFKEDDIIRLTISSQLDNGVLVFLLLISLVLFVLAFLNQLGWIRLLSFVPPLMLLRIYYLKRNRFFTITAY